MCNLTMGFTVPPTGWSCTSLSTVCSTWSGVSCASNAVISISISTQSALKGTLSPSIGNINTLTYLLLQSLLGLTGTIPTQIGQLIALQYLQTSSTALSGTIPSTIGQIQALTLLKLSYCSFAGKHFTVCICISIYPYHILLRKALFRLS